MQEPMTIQTNPLMDLAQAKDYDKLLSLHSLYPLSEIAAAAEFLRDRDIYHVALVLYQHLLNHQETADYHYSLGLCYGKTYQYLSALTHLRKAFHLQPDRTEGSHYYAYILERNLVMNEAEHWYQMALRHGYNNDLWTVSHYAYFLEKYHKPLAAEQYYQLVLDCNPAYTWAVKRYALFLLKQCQYNRSLKLMQDAIAQHGTNPFVQLNYLEYLILQGNAPGYEAYLRSLLYDQMALPFQTLVDLFDYFWRYLLTGQTNPEKLAAYQEKAKQLKDTIHRDFDDLTELLVANQGNVSTWQHLTKLLVK